MNRASVVSLAVILLAASTATVADAQWVPNGIPVGSTGQFQDQDVPFVCADGQGGCFVAWGEEVVNSTTEVDDYLQHVLADGRLDPRWPSRGMAFVVAPNLQNIAAMVADGSGGVIILWLDLRSANSENDLYALRVGADGQLADGWTPNGVPVAVGPGGRQPWSACADGSGGAYFAWDDFAGGFDRAMFMHLAADGAPATGWPVGGKLVSSNPAQSGIPLLLPELDGCLVTWADARGATALGYNMRALRFAATGEAYAGWDTAGVPILTTGSAVEVRHTVSDGAGGLFVGWDDARAETSPFDFDIYAQHVFANGARDARWPQDGVAVCNAPGNQFDFSMAEDASGGCVFMWDDYRPFGLYGQRLLGDGTVAPGWVPNGTQVSTGPWGKSEPRIAGDGLGGFFGVFVENASSGSVPIVGQHMRGDGTFDPSWSPAGVTLATNAECDQPAIAPDALGGAVLAYRRFESAIGSRIYAERIQPDGPVPTLLTFAEEQTTAGTVRLTWFTPDGSGQRAVAQRSTDGVSWDGVAQLTSDAAGEFVLEDRMPAGGRFDYRLGVAAPGGEQFTDGHWVVIPVGVAFGLTSVGPNPSRGSVIVTFAMAEAGAASLDLFNVAGRRVLHRDVTALSVGAHTLELAKDGQLPSGVYMLRLVQGARTAERKIAVVR